MLLKVGLLVLRQAQMVGGVASASIPGVGTVQSPPPPLICGEISRVIVGRRRVLSPTLHVRMNLERRRRRDRLRRAREGHPHEVVLDLDRGLVVEGSGRVGVTMVRDRGLVPAPWAAVTTRGSPVLVLVVKILLEKGPVRVRRQRRWCDPSHPPLASRRSLDLGDAAKGIHVASGQRDNIFLRGPLSEEAVLEARCRLGGDEVLAMRFRPCTIHAQAPGTVPLVHRVPVLVHGLALVIKRDHAVRLHGGPDLVVDRRVLRIPGAVGSVGKMLHRIFNVGLA